MQSMSELQEKNRAQCSVSHVQEMAPIGGDHCGKVTVPVISPFLTVSVPTDPLGEALPSCE